MNKTIGALTLIYLCLMGTTSADTVRIYNKNPIYQMNITYKACFRERHKNNRLDCLPDSYTHQLNRFEPFTEIKLPEYLEIAKVTHVMAQDNKGNIIAEGNYLQEEDCKVFEHNPISLVTNDETKLINCQYFS